MNENPTSRITKIHAVYEKTPSVFTKNTFSYKFPSCSLKFKKLSNIISQSVTKMPTRRSQRLDPKSKVYCYLLLKICLVIQWMHFLGPLCTQSDFSIKKSTTRLFANRITEERRRNISLDIVCFVYMWNLLMTLEIYNRWRRTRKMDGTSADNL